ncbi:MAG: L,D-transpeptidase [Lachnospiraceae bacterium]|nr:L,D-transpeptidase [Lachnospiraceae bacterium]
MKKRIGYIFITIISFLLILIAGVYFFGVYYFRHWFFPNTYINGINVSNDQYYVCDDIIRSQIVNHNIVVEDEDDTQIFIDGNEIYSYNEEEIEDAIAKIKTSQNPYLWPKSLFVKSEYVYNPQRFLNEERLLEIVSESSLGKKDRYDASRKAEITYSEEKGYELVDDTHDLLDWQLCQEKILDASVRDTGFVSLKDNGTYKSIEADAQYYDLLNKWEKISKTIDFDMTYKLATGESIEVDSSVVSNFLLLDEDGEVMFDEDGDAMLDSEKILAYVQELSDTYDNMYSDKKFKTTRGDVVTIPYSRYTTYGSLMNVKAEAEELEKIVKSHKSPGEREPIYIKKEDRGTFNNGYNGTYVEVDVTGQHMYYYVDYRLVFDTDVVTGCKANGNMTPDCVCYIVNKARNVTLIGPGYESFVYHWMCITGQIGIHDATWRRTFGGEIYLYGGSHGCVNTPLDKMSELFQMIEIGTPVIVHQ